jgi:hypothetical protein
MLLEQRRKPFEQGLHLRIIQNPPNDEKLARRDRDERRVRLDCFFDVHSAVSHMTHRTHRRSASVSLNITLTKAERQAAT